MLCKLKMQDASSLSVDMLNRMYLLAIVCQAWQYYRIRNLHVYQVNSGGAPENSLIQHSMGLEVTSVRRLLDYMETLLPYLNLMTVLEAYIDMVTLYGLLRLDLRARMSAYRDVKIEDHGNNSAVPKVSKSG